MAEQFTDQGGAATMNPPALLRWATSLYLRRKVRPEALAARRDKAEKARVHAGAPHQIEYFHQIEDGYSHLAAQLLRPLQQRYDVELVCHLVTVARDRNLPEPDLLLPLSRYEATRIAPHYGLHFPQDASAPPADLYDRATRILAGVSQEAFPDAAVAVGEALFSGDGRAMDSLEERYGSVDASAAEARLRQGSERRDQLGHYSGAMFHYGGDSSGNSGGNYGGEWFWGADRFYHLESRLIELGARKGPEAGLLCPRPAIDSGPRVDTGSLTLEIYPSLRSPYTSIIFDRAVQLARETGVRMVMRPVLPMVMRGVSVTRTKGEYIFTDTAREAASLGLDWGGFYDPIGDPVRNGYSLYPWACKQGKGTELLSSFLRCAFFESVNTNNDAGMRRVVEGAGLSFEEARGIMGNREWEEDIEANRLAMYEFGSWGVPSFRLLDREGREVLGVWGQDRLWLVAKEIQRLLAESR